MNLDETIRFENETVRLVRLNSKAQGHFQIAANLSGIYVTINNPKHLRHG